jgi:hypothetical protein
LNAGVLVLASRNQIVPPFHLTGGIEVVGIDMPARRRDDDR